MSTLQNVDTRQPFKWCYVKSFEEHPIVNLEINTIMNEDELEYIKNLDFKIQKFNEEKGLSESFKVMFGVWENNKCSRLISIKLGKGHVVNNINYNRLLDVILECEANNHQKSDYWVRVGSFYIDYVKSNVAIVDTSEPDNYAYGAFYDDTTFEFPNNLDEIEAKAYLESIIPKDRVFTKANADTYPKYQVCKFHRFKTDYDIIVLTYESFKGANRRCLARFTGNRTIRDVDLDYVDEWWNGK